MRPSRSKENEIGVNPVTNKGSSSNYLLFSRGACLSNIEWPSTKSIRFESNQVPCLSPARYHIHGFHPSDCPYWVMFNGRKLLKPRYDSGLFANNERVLPWSCLVVRANTNIYVTHKISSTSACGPILCVFQVLPVFQVSWDCALCSFRSSICSCSFSIFEIYRDYSNLNDSGSHTGLRIFS